jgi:DNA-binding NtrC family response regulator
MSRIKVLLVDDEAEFVHLMAARIAARDMESRVALTGAEALRMVRDEAPDVMVLDLRMPGIDGMQVLERVKAEHPGVEVVVLTGQGSDVEKREARRLGAAAYLQKPADMSQLLETIEAAWRRGVRMVRDAAAEVDRSLAAAALAEANAPELARGMLERPAPAPHAEGAVAGPGDTRGREPALKVLFVDDEEDFVRTMAERLALRDLGGEVALSGQQALDKVASDVPDVMVLDLKMPGLDGMEVLRRVKRSHPRLEVIIMTGHGSDADREEALQLGAFEYLQKPVDLGRLMDAVRRAGRARHGTG